MSQTPEDKFRQKVSEYDYVRFAVCDIFGRSRCKIIPARNAAKLINKGTEMWIGKYEALLHRLHNT